jgi:hypothetical protein
MTKEELVRQAAKCFPSKVTTVIEEKAFIEGFVRGAEWMQAKMQESNEGQALLYAVEKTAERTKREVIEKVVEWMRNFKDGQGNFPLYDYVGNLKQAMKDESK